MRAISSLSVGLKKKEKEFWVLFSRKSEKCFWEFLIFTLVWEGMEEK